MRLSILAAFFVIAAHTAISGAHNVAAEGEAADIAVEGQTCTPGFTVQVSLSWTPSGAGQQWLDISLHNDGFSSPYIHGGPFNASRSEATVNNLEPQRNYYVRVSTWNGSEWARSELFAFVTGCLPYEATGPRHVSGVSLSDTVVKFSWQPGNGNRWYCLDYAATSEDLLNKAGTWRNSGCGMTNTTHVVNGLHCDRTYFARVWAWTAQGGRHSGQVTVNTSPCATSITAPTDLRPLFAAPHLTRLSWTPGQDSIWYCVDLALNLKDLLTLSGTWENHCGLMQPEIELSRLNCDTSYVWRVYTWNYHANAHSDVRQFVTKDCSLDDQLARVDGVEVHKSEDGSYRAEVAVFLANGCHQPGQYQIEREGNTILITVENLVDTAPTTCSASSGPHHWSIRLGGNFSPGATYKIEVNGQRSDTFTAS